MNQINKWIKESEQETTDYLIQQANEDLSFITLYHAKSQDINRKMSEFLGGLK